MSPAAAPSAAAHHHRQARRAKNVAADNSRNVPSAYPMTKVKAAGARQTSQAARAANRSSPVSHRTRPTRTAVPARAQALATTTTAVPTLTPGRTERPRARRGKRGKNRNEAWPAPE